MKGFGRSTVLMLLAVSLVLPVTATAGDEDLCPTGGTMVMVAVDKDKAVEWLEDGRRAFLLSEDDTWQLKTVSDASDKIALVLTEGYLFFGVADDRDGREVDERRMSKAFKFLKGAVQKEVKAMWKAGVIDIAGGDVQNIVSAVGIGVVAQDGRDWGLETADCEGMTVNVEDLD